MMKKCLSLILALCLLLAVSPAALAEYDQKYDGDQISTQVIGGTMQVKIWQDAEDEEPVATAEIPVNDSLMSARIELPYGTDDYECISFDAYGIQFAFDQKAMKEYGLDKVPNAEQALQSLLLEKGEDIIYTRNLDIDEEWDAGQYSLNNKERREKQFGSVYETTFALQAGVDVSDRSEEAAKHFLPSFLPSARAEWIEVVCDIEPVFFRYFITNGPKIIGTEYNAEQGKLYDTLRKQGSEEDWSVTFDGAAAGQLTGVSFGSELTVDEDYSVEDVGGDLKFTLKGGFLKNLPAGYHKIELSFNAPNDTASETALLINVVGEMPAAVSVPSVPTTGDNTQLLLWSALLCASLGVSVWMFGRSRKKATR